MELAVGASEATLKSLLSKLGGLLADEYALIRGVRGDVQFITDELASMQAFLSNLARAGGVDGHDDQTRDWMKQVRDVSYDIEDCVDDFAHSLRPDPRGDGCLVAIRRTLYEIRTCSARRSIATQILDLKLRAQQIGERRGRYGVRDPGRGKRNGSGGVAESRAAENQQITRQLVRVQEPVGVSSDDLHKLRDWMDPGKNSKLSVLSIVGFGGVGKTTVALSVFRKYGDQFQRRAMVTVSQNSDPELVLKNILRQVEPQATDGEHQGEDSIGAVAETKNRAALVTSLLGRICLQTSDQQNDGAWDEKHKGIKADLEKHLQTRYLALIDDVWSSSTWQTIRRYFPDNNNGSRIIVTTRFPAVAATCSADEDTDSIHQVKVLSDGVSEKLFQKSISECNVTGDNIPDRVWKMCGGLPLAIVTTAGLVASTQMRTSEEWIKVCDSLFPNSQICRKPEDFMRIINHCYNDLASDLKTCSLYLSIFPKGRKISRKRLIRRWIAEGFISEKQGLSVEDVADTCFNQLISRKIIRPIQNCSNGTVKSCQVHDMVLEYIISKAAEEDFVTVVGSHWTVPTRSNKVRRLSLHSSDSKRAKEVDTMNLSHVRSLTMFGSLDKLRFKSFKSGIVQVLDLQGCKGFKDVKVSEICKMILLKYLNLRRTDIKHLPPNICKLKYLETLDIRETEVQELPKTIGQLERISNLLCGNKNTRKGVKLPKEIKKGTMNTLRVLSGIEIVEGSTSASNLHDFTGLRKLAIYKLHKDKAIFKDLLSCIQYLGGYSLQTLVIDDESSDFFSTLYSMPAPPTYLSTLELSGKLLKLPEWFPDLKDLTKLTLSATVLGTDNLVLLSKLRSLFSLTFSVSAAKQGPDMAAILEKNRSDSGGEIFLPAGGFSKLKLLRIFVPLLPSINFSRKATPQLERIELRFKRLEGLHGMEKLKTLHDVLLTVDGIGSEPTKSILEDLKRVPSSKYTLIVNEYLD